MLVKSILKAKKHKQIVFATHNPNIPVLGDAELVVAMASDGERGAVSDAGGVDAVRAPLERLLEGGREAFLRRGERYGHRTEKRGAP